MKALTHKIDQYNLFGFANIKDLNWRKCKNCGRFISYNQMQSNEAKFVFIPDTEFTTEEAYWVHNKCK